METQKNKSENQKLAAQRARSLFGDLRDQGLELVDDLLDGRLFWQFLIFDGSSGFVCGFVSFFGSFLDSLFGLLGFGFDGFSGVLFGPFDGFGGLLLDFLDSFGGLGNWLLDSSWSFGSDGFVFLLNVLVDVIGLALREREKRLHVMRAGSTPSRGASPLNMKASQGKRTG